MNLLSAPVSAGLISGLRRLGRGALVALAVALPFELVVPLARVGPLQVSSVELVLYAVIGIWAAARALALGAGRAGGWTWRWPSVAHRAVALWAVVLVVSALCAPLARAASIKFALRSLGGVALFWAAADLLDSPAAVARTGVGLGAGALVAALLMLAEAYLPGFAPCLRLFHEQTFQIFGLVRASGPFQYPNIAAMYLEAVLPVLLVVGFAALERDRARGLRRGAIAGAAAAAALVLVCALAAAASRAGLGAVLVAFAALAAWAGGDRRLRRAALGFMALIGLAFALTQAASPLLALRLRFWRDHAWYRSTIALSPAAAAAPPRQMRAGAETVVGLVIHNQGEITWPRAGAQPVHVSYHWTDATTGVTVAFEGLRTRLPRDLPPGAQAEVSASVRAPARPGRYRLRWDLVHEYVTWFSDRGDPGTSLAVEVGTDVVVPSYPARLAADPEPPPARPPLGAVERRDLWRAGLAAWRQHPWLGIGPDNFRRSYGRYLGLDDAHADDRLHANNLYVETAANLGLAGLLALGALAVGLARAARRGAAAPATRPLALGLAAALAAYAAHGLADYFFEFTPTYGLFWLLAGMLVAVGAEHRTPPLSPPGGPS